MLNTFHFLRPYWFAALLPLALLLWLQWRRRQAGGSWQAVVDPQLLPFLLIGQGAARRPWRLAALALGGVLAILALAGPAWRKLEQPVFRQHAALVILLDLSRSMTAGDLKPSRLARAQLKLRDILAQQKEGETALIVFAGMPFVVSPLTPDANTIASQISSLTPDLMPEQGSRPDRAIALAQKLLQQAGASHGGVLLITDGVDDPARSDLDAASKNLLAAGHRLSVLGVGTAEGAPIPLADGGFIKGDDGAIVLPRLDDTGLNAVAQLGGGSYRRLALDDSDFQALLAPLKSPLPGNPEQAEAVTSDQWQDEGPWLLWPLVLLAALGFRRGYGV